MRKTKIDPLKIILAPFGRNTATALEIAALNEVENFKGADIETII
tara:strand:- start:449 stop:583 length:135 start_codon:yes stop_codon:yes gene_type:complete